MKSRAPGIEVLPLILSAPSYFQILFTPEYSFTRIFWVSESVSVYSTPFASLVLTVTLFVIATPTFSRSTPLFLASLRIETG